MAACGGYRIAWPATHVANIRPDWDIEVYGAHEASYTVDSHGNFADLQGVPNPTEVDLFVLQRVGRPAQLSFIRWAQQHGIAVVVDNDDALWAIHPDNVAHAHWSNARNHFKHADLAADLADLATVTTPLLVRRYGLHGRVEVLPNFVLREAAELPSLREAFDPTPTIGWAGFTGVHPEDLHTVGTAVADAVVETSCKVRAIGDGIGVAEAWGIASDAIEVSGLAEFGAPYFQELTSLDVGLVPLEPSRFNDCKSWLKALEYSSQGVAVVATATPENTRLRDSGVPILLAESPAEWRSHILDLLNDPEGRRQRAAAAKSMVLKDFTIEAHAEGWAAAWERAVARRRALLR